MAQCSQPALLEPQRCMHCMCQARPWQGAHLCLGSCQALLQGSLLLGSLVSVLLGALGLGTLLGGSLFLIPAASIKGLM